MRDLAGMLSAVILVRLFWSAVMGSISFYNKYRLPPKPSPDVASAPWTVTSTPRATKTENDGST